MRRGDASTDDASPPGGRRRRWLWPVVGLVLLVTLPFLATDREPPAASGKVTVEYPSAAPGVAIEDILYAQAEAVQPSEAWTFAGCVLPGPWWERSYYSGPEQVRPAFEIEMNRLGRALCAAETDEQRAPLLAQVEELARSRLEAR